MVNISRNFLMMLKNLLPMHLKPLQNESFKKKAEVTGDLIGNKTADKMTRVSKASLKNNSETNKEEIIRDEYISLELTRKKLKI